MQEAGGIRHRSKERKDMQRRGSQRATQQVPDSPETGIQHRELS